MASIKTKCERCGFNAKKLEELYTHAKLRTCNPLKSNTSYDDIIARVKSYPIFGRRICPTCDHVFATVCEQKEHAKTCHATTNLSLTVNPSAVASASASVNASANTSANLSESANASANTSANVSTSIINPTPEKHKYIHKNVPDVTGLHPFTEDIDWANEDIPKDVFEECCLNTSQGIVDLFAYLHSLSNHNNICWHNGRILVFDGKGWTEATDKMFANHLWHIYSILEESWYDYKMNIRCGITAESSISEIDETAIDDYYYTKIVDDESVLFHSMKQLQNYLNVIQ